MTGNIVTRRPLMSRIYTRMRRDVRSLEIQITLKVSRVQPRISNASLVISMDTSQASVTRRNKHHSSQINQRPIYYKWVQYMLVTSPYAATQKIVHPAMTHSVCKWKYSNHKLKVRRFPHPLT